MRHDDPEMRNVTYRQSDGRFCLIDFEFATILPETVDNAPWTSRLITPPRAACAGTGGPDKGPVRANNEDAFLALQFDAREVHYLGKIGEASTENADFVFAVSDGMGGAKAGELASRITVDKITHLLPLSFRQSALGMAPGIDDIFEEPLRPGPRRADLSRLGR